MMTKAEETIEIKRQIELAADVKLRNGTTLQAAVCRLWHSKRRFTLGFNFHKVVAVGDVFQNDDGTKSEVVAVV